jgi:hypothetical protein
MQSIEWMVRFYLLETNCFEPFWQKRGFNLLICWKQIALSLFGKSVLSLLATFQPVCS